MRLYKTLKSKKSLIAFLTAGYPEPEKTKQNAYALQKGGADALIIGVPFSDPHALPKELIKANFHALSKGVSLPKVFDIIKSADKLSIPVALYCFINSAFVYGYAEFFSKCAELGVSGVIIPDLPFKERHEISGFAKEANVSVIPIITPLREDWLNKIVGEMDCGDKGFIYYLYPSDHKTEQNHETLQALSAIRKLKAATDVPLAITCNAASPQEVKKYLQISDAIIVDSSVARKIDDNAPNAEEALTQYMKVIKYSMI